jgi:hypothetical protein
LVLVGKSDIEISFLFFDFCLELEEHRLLFEIHKIAVFISQTGTSG